MKCSKCGDNEAAPGHVWCRNCKAVHQRERRDGEEHRLVTRGAEQMRSLAIQTFMDLGNREMTGLTAAQVMRSLTLSQQTEM